MNSNKLKLLFNHIKDKAKIIYNITLLTEQPHKRSPSNILNNQERIEQIESDLKKYEHKTNVNTIAKDKS